MTRSRGPNPYCAFEDDQERRRALVSRDVRLVLIALVSAVASIPAAQYAWPWLQSLLH